MKAKSVSLGEIATVVAGQSPPGSTYNETGLGMPFFQGKADFGEIHPIARKWCTSPKRIAEEGDILISIRAPVGPTNIALERCCIGRGLAMIRPNEAITLRNFVHWSIVHRRAELIAKGRGSTFAAIGKNDLKSLKILLPSLDEQRRIAGILDRAARIERLRARAADRLRVFAPALFVKMFGDPEENPMDWPMHPLTELLRDGTRYVGKIRKRDYKESGEIPIVDQGVTQIAGYTDEVEGQFKGKLPAIVFGDHTRRFKLIRSRFLMGADGTKLLIPNRETIDPVFLYAHLKCLTIEEAGYSRHFKFLKQKSLMLPPFDKQLQFRTIFDALEDLAVDTGIASKAISSLTSSLMDRLLNESPTP